MRELDELRPCPFCGGKAELCTYKPAGLSWVRCIECGANNDASLSETEAAEAWNTRVYSKTSNEELLVRLFQTWLEKEHEAHTCHDDNTGGSFVCSKCGANIKDTYIGSSYVDKFGKRWYATSNGQAFNYCPNCGAKIIEG